VLNQPYGGFHGDMPQYANENWYNAHNFMVTLQTLTQQVEDVDSFFKTFYAPQCGYFCGGDLKQKMLRNGWQYFGASNSELPASRYSEPVQEKEKRFTKEDKLATKRHRRGV